MNGIASYIVSVLAGVSTHYICKWLDSRVNYSCKNCKH